MGAGGTWGISVPSVQFCYESRAALKMPIFFKVGEYSKSEDKEMSLEGALTFLRTQGQ